MLHFGFIWAFLLLPLPAIFYFIKNKEETNTQPALKVPFFQRINAINSNAKNNSA